MLIVIFVETKFDLFFAFIVYILLIHLLICIET